MYHNSTDADTRISIIVPVYNKELFIEKCLESLINQTYQKIEIICVDDGSTDKSGLICDKYANLDSRVKVIHKANSGLPSSRKTGLLASNGKYIMYVDSDDWLEKNACETLMNVEKQTNADVIEFGFYTSMKESNEPSFPFFSDGLYLRNEMENIIFPKMIFTGNYYSYGVSVYVWSKFYKKSIIYEHQMSVGEYTNMDEDTVCVFPCVAFAESIYFLHENLYHYRIVNDSIMHTWDKKLEINEKKRIDELREKLCQSPFYWVFSKQIDVFEKYALSLYAPQLFDIDSDKCLNVYGGIPKGAKISIYGAGTAGKILSEYIKESECCEIVSHVDKNYKTLGIDGINSPNTLMVTDQDFIIIAVFKYSSYISVLKDLENLNIREAEIRWIDGKYRL